MKKGLFIFLIFCFSLTIISCSDEEEESTTTTDTTALVIAEVTVVTTVAGTGSTGSANGTGTSASFYTPLGVTTDGTNLYVAGLYYHLIRKIVISTGVVTTLAGTGSSGSANGTGTSASFYKPAGITTDGTNLYVTEGAGGNHLIRKIE